MFFLWYGLLVLSEIAGFSYLKERHNEMSLVPRPLPGIILFALLLTCPAVDAMPCNSSGGCADCFNDPDTGLASCDTVYSDAHCDCTISVTNLRFCILEELCDYTGGAGGGTGGGTGGGGGGTCTRSSGGWCPAECSSCSTVYWN